MGKSNPCDTTNSEPDCPLTPLLKKELYSTVGSSKLFSASIPIFSASPFFCCAWMDLLCCATLCSTSFTLWACKGSKPQAQTVVIRMILFMTIVFVQERTLLRFIHSYIIGIIKAFRKVEVSRPPNITLAIGLWISLPGRSPRRASGIRARADESAVIRMGFKRSSDPCRMLSRNDNPSSRNVL